ncbi:MAG: M20 family metallopeptidase [Anaerolineaceae bacterium]|nr:M20 family metallopeptidase [Anaerolineaceae bacterium]
MGMDKSALRAEVSRSVEDNEEDLVRITQELIRTPSINPPGDYDAIAKKMFGFYQAEGLAPVIACASREEVEALELSYPRPNVIARVEGKNGSPVFCLDAHMDVVEPGDENSWRFSPFGGEIHDGKIYGRGSEDTKCHLAAQLIALRAIKQAGIELKGDLILSATVDDEIGGWPGMGYLIDKGFKEHGFKVPDYHIAGEPTGLETVGCLARGRLWYEIVFRGVSAHGGNPKDGVNAIEKAIALANAVRCYPIYTDPLMGSDTINLGILHGGEAINIVPGRCKITFDVRPATDIEIFKRFMEETIQSLGKSDPDFIIESIRLLNDRQTGGIGPEHEFVKTVQCVVREMTGIEVVPSGNMDGYSSLGNAYWTSMRGAAGLMYGGGDFQRAHSVDEYITIDELVEITKVFAALIVELCC